MCSPPSTRADAAQEQANADASTSTYRIAGFRDRDREQHERRADDVDEQRDDT